MFYLFIYLFIYLFTCLLLQCNVWLQAFGVDVQSLSEVACRAGMMTLYSASDYSVWLIIAVTVERYVVVCRPLHAASVCRRRRAVSVMAVLVFTFVSINLHFVWTTGLRSVQV